jgi:hypothetical protein
MAIVKLNDLTEGLSGAIGNLVFRQLRGKTVLSGKANSTKKQSLQQLENRNKFKRASTHVKFAMRNAELKEYYADKAAELKLPNAYTAALKEYLRNGKLATSDIKIQ